MNDAEASGGFGAALVSRRIMEMVGELHHVGYGGLYLDCGISPSGFNWRFAIGSAANGRWPNRELSEVTGSIGDERDPHIPWCGAADLVRCTEKFRATYPDLLQAAQVPNQPYVDWYRMMLAKTAPDGVLMFYSDYGPSYAFATVWQNPGRLKIPTAPGCLV